MIGLVFDNNARLADLDRDGGNLITDETLETAVLISLFTNRRADPDDVLPDPLGSREGWWGDVEPDVEGDQLGSKLWLLRRSKATQAVMNQAKVHIQDALQWMIDDGVAESIEVEVERQVDKRLAFRVEILKPDDPSGRWVGVWAKHLEEL